MSAQAQAARSFINVGRPGDAIRVLLEGLSTSPDDYELHCLLAQAYLGINQPKEALRVADEGARLAPDDEWPHRLRSFALRRLGRHRESLAAATEAVRLEPQLAVARRNLADAHLEIKHYDQAYVEALEARGLDPQSADSYDLLGRCLVAKRKYKEAEANFRYAIQLDPNDAVSHNNLGVVLQRQGRRAEAVNAFNDAARIDPALQTARQNLYSGTRFLIGGGSAVFLGYLVIRLIVVGYNASHRSPWLLAAVFALFLVGLAVWIWRFRPFSRKQLPPTAVAYYMAERKRLSVANRPILLLRLAGIPVVIAGFVLAIALNQPAVLLVGIVVAFALLWLSPWAWRHLVRPGQV